MQTPSPDHLQLDRLNPEQLTAVTSEAAPLCILAGAGSGKTRVLTTRIAYRAYQNTLDLSKVLALTFTRKAAGELSSRLRAFGLRDRIAAGTFHAVAYAQLRTYWSERSINPPTLLTRKASFLAPLLSSSERSTPALDFIAEIEWAKARMITPENYAEQAQKAGRTPPVSFTQCASVYERYEKHRREKRAIDFDDMLRVCLHYLETDEAFADVQRWRFGHFFVDEFQDVNPLQFALLEKWRADRNDLCVVGDPNQAIYAWNGADPKLLREFASHYPDATVLRLTSNYRSTPQVLTLANTLLRSGGDIDAGGKQQSMRPDGPIPNLRSFATDAAEAQAIARAVRDSRAPGTPWSSQAVLVRTNAQLAVIEEALTAAQIPFRVRGSMPFLDLPEIKTAISQLQTARGDLSEFLHDLALSQSDEVETERAAERRANIEALIQLGHDFAGIEPSGGPSEFVHWLRITPRADQPDKNEDAVELLTFHSAKGLEWPTVHIAGLEQGFVPISYAKTPEAWAEEKRLLYVALTRAEKNLNCSYALRRTFGERVMDRSPSEFLEQLDDVIRALQAGLDPIEIENGKRSSAAPAKFTPRVSRSASSPKGKGRGPTRYPETLSETDRDLFDALRAWRADLARKADSPAFIICNDATLVEIATKRPTTPSQLIQVHGLGESKVARYGVDIFTIVNSFS